MTEIGGLDFSLTKPDPAMLKRLGFSFVMGYVSTSAAKNLSATQVANYRGAGLQVGLVWETTANRSLDGSAAGAADGAEARRQANALGYPASCVIFFAVDFAASAAQITGPIRAYASAFKAAAGVAGVYGSFNVVEALVGSVVPYGWQTAAWSGGRFSTKAHIYQRAQATNWPAVQGTDENVLCIPLPLYGSAPTPPPEVDVPLTGDDVNNIWRSPLLENQGVPILRLIEMDTTLGAVAQKVDGLADAVSKLQAGATPTIDEAKLAAALLADPAAVQALGKAIADNLQLAPRSNG